MEEDFDESESVESSVEEDSKESKTRLQRDFELIEEKLVTEKINYLDAEKFSEEIRGGREMLKAQLSYFKNLFVQIEKKMSIEKKALKDEWANLESSPFKEILKMQDDMVKILIEVQAWHVRRFKIAELYADRLEISLKEAKGLSLTQQVLNQATEFVDSRETNLWMRFEQILQQQNTMYQKNINDLLDRSKFDKDAIEALIGLLKKNEMKFAHLEKSLRKNKQKFVKYEDEDEDEELEEEQIAEEVVKEEKQQVQGIKAVEVQQQVPQVAQQVATEAMRPSVFKCETCGQKFVLEAAYKRHLAWHEA